MSKVEQAESQVRKLTAAELQAFRQWFTEFDAAWDQHFEADVKAGKFNDLAERALRDHDSGLART